MNRAKVVVAVAFLAAVVLCGCTSQSNHAERRRDYWPTTGWKTTSPEEQGIDSIVSADIDAHAKKNLRDFTSILLVRHGYIVYERYLTGDENTQRKLWSATKSVTSMMAGAALRDGFIQSVDQKVVEILPELNGGRAAQAGKEITIRHLLTMTSGLDAGSSWGAPSFKQVKSCFAKPLKSVPGEQFNYTDVCPQLISIILTKITGKSAYEFGKQALFAPLGIENIQWAMAESGISDGAGGIFMTARDMAKLGYLYLNDGIWDGRQLIASDWIIESTKLQAVYQKGNKPKDKVLNIDYGFLWWVNTATKPKLFWAHGYGGQTITVVPELDIVLVTTSRREAMAETDHLFLLNKVILPSVNRR